MRVQLVERVASDVWTLVDDQHAPARVGELTGDHAAGVAGADD
jgi:hypothetical protein